MGVYDDIKLGLEQAIEYEKGNLKTKKTKLSICPVPVFSAEDIKTIRRRTGLSQALFAKYMGVSVKTVEAWEAGRNHPDGASARLLALTQADASFPIISGIVSI